MADSRDLEGMNEDWLAVLVGLGLIGLVVMRLVGQVPW